MHNKNLERKKETEKWSVKIQEPSGNSRTLSIQGNVTFGRSHSMGLVLQDPTLALQAGVFQCSEQNGLSEYWVSIPQHSPPGYIADVAIREAQVPLGIPLKIGETVLTFEGPFQHNKARNSSENSNQRSRSSMDLPVNPSGVRPWLTCSESGAQALWIAKKAASTSLSIYVAGQTGTGKEVMAQLIHSWSERKSGPFVPLHCGALSLSLAESELFGHVKGAFTGADHHRPGALMQAHSGTLFLDEVGDLPMDIQVKLLRFLENGEIRPVGSDRASKANVRVICATHHPLQKLVEEKKFRQDLYYRLASVTVSIPPLYSRPKDIELLARRFSSELGRSLSSKALLRLKAHSWPGNVRELRHAIERACGMAGPFQTILPEESFEFLLTPDHIAETPELEIKTAALTLREMERIMLVKALKLSNGNRTVAAKILGVARSTIFEMLKRHRIRGPRKSELLLPNTQS